MVAPDDDRRRNFAGCDKVVDCHAELRARALPQPADSGGQSLKADSLRRQLQPAPQMLVIRKEIQREAVRSRDVRGISRERNPPERPFTLAKKRADVLRHKSGYVERVRDAGV